MPDMNDADPYNWPQSKKVTNLILVAFHAMTSTFTASAIQASFEAIAEDFSTTLQRASYLTSIVIAVLGVAPLFWRPLSERYGRRPIFIASLLLSLVGNIGCAKSPSYSTMAFCRAITAFFISPALSIGSGVVMESFFKQERARYIGIWTLMVTLGIPVAPLIFGFVSMRVGYRWTYWILAMINAVQLLLYIPFGPETRYVRGQIHSGSSFNQEYLRFKRIDKTPLRLYDFIHPLTLCTKSRIMIPAVIYAMIFCFGGVFTTLEIPQLYVEKYHLNAQQVGIQYVAIIIGSVLGEVVGGHLSDMWMAWRRKRDPAVKPEFRLWLSYIGFILTIVGDIVFVVQIDRAGNTITPDIGAAIAGIGNQIVTTVLITFAVDSHREEAASIGVFIIFVRQMWGFVGPFWFPEMLRTVGLSPSAGIITAMILVCSVLPAIYLQWRGRSRTA
ncbi:hypothetical protein DL546_004486 [Coniochaeta pulveracea]|nr:hypothetical protein DL546_004486 [Coniochaeta pulveracea]